jgi:CBS domain containing-hemolysin-like protein
MDDVVGLAHVKHAVAVPRAERRTRTVADVMAPMSAVPETMELDPLLEILRRPGLQMAVVVDEYGGTAGIVTLEDLVEEIVGEIADEQDDPLRRLRREPDGSWLLSGLLRPDEVGAELDLELPESATTDTIAGLVTERLGRLPGTGDCVVLPVRDRASTDEDGLPTDTEIELTVVRLEGHRVDVLRLRRRGATALSRITAGREGRDDG